SKSDFFYNMGAILGSVFSSPSIQWGFYFRTTPLFPVKRRLDVSRWFCASGSSICHLLTLEYKRQPLFSFSMASSPKPEFACEWHVLCARFSVFWMLPTPDTDLSLPLLFTLIFLFEGAC